MENAALPPLFTAVKLHDSFSSAQRGGKVAIAALPLLIAAETLQRRYAPARVRIETLPASTLMSLISFSTLFPHTFMSLGPISSQMYFVRVGPNSE